MPFGSTDDLYEQVESWLEAPDLREEIPDFVRLAEIELGRDIGWRFEMEQLDATLAAASTELALPADAMWVESLAFLPADGPWNVQIVSHTQFYELQRMLQTSSLPTHARHLGFKLKFPTQLPTDTSYELVYWKLMTPLSDTTATNWLLANGFDALLFGACMQGKDFRGEDPGRFEVKYARAKTSLERLEWRARFKGGSTAVQTDRQNLRPPRRFRV